MKALQITFAFLTVIIFPRMVISCSCAGTTSVCDAFGRSEAVFVGAVARVENQTAKAEDGREFVAGQTAYVQVQVVIV